MKPFLRLRNPQSNNSHDSENENQNLPIYAIVLICVSWAVLPGALMILLYYIADTDSSSKADKVEDNGPIREVWSNPDTNNANSSILWDKMKCLKIKKKNSNTSKSNILGSNTCTSNISNTIEFNK
jgi:hypothetical protein